jgi:hypothetical protein
VRGGSGSLIYYLTAPIRLFGRSRAFRWSLAAVLILVGSFAAANWALERFMPSGGTTPPALAKLPPLPDLPPVTRASYVIAPVAVALPAIRASLDAAAPRELIGKNDNPVSALLSAADIGITVGRGPLTVTGRPGDLAVASTLNGSLKVTGEIATQAGNLVGSLAGLVGGALNQGGSSGSGGSSSSKSTQNDNPIAGFLSGVLGNDSSKSGGKSGGSNSSSAGKTVGDATTKVLDQRADLHGKVIMHSRPAITANWRLQPNLSAQLDLGDSAIQLAGIKLNMTAEARPLVDGMVNQQVANLEQWLRDSPIIENAAREQWAKMCRAIPLGGGKTGLPDLWLELRPIRAAAAQPRIDASNVTLTIGVQAETRITSKETKPTCPFPNKLELTAPMDDGRLQVGLPIDVPFTELNKLLEAQLKGHTYPEDGSGPAAVTVNHVHVGASGDRLLVALDVTARENKSWFGFGANATVQIWGKPALDRDNQILRLTDTSLAVESDAAFGLLGAAARAAVPYLEKALAEQAVVDLKPFATDALKKIDVALADFEQNKDGVSVNAAVNRLTLTGIAFDSHTLRVIAQADGRAKVTVTQLPKM